MRTEQRKRLAAKRARHQSRAAMLVSKGSLAKRIQHHLDKGRDAADIVIREGIPASIITAEIAKLLACTPRAALNR